MIHFTKKDIETKERIKRLNIINSITGIKPGNLIGSISKSGISNLAVFSSVVHLGSSPALLGFILRPTGEVPRHTYQNILETGYYTVNHIPISKIENAHFTSAKYNASVSEFEMCNFSEEYISNFKAPFVEESKIKIGLKYIESIPISINGTVLVIGEIQHIVFPENALSEEGIIDLSITESVGIGGLNGYYGLKKLSEFPFARTSNIPHF